ncbi:MAG: hypothetical protein QNJ73_02110 [Gammaproteobacteria bacterium]|nr:hypothetical protein [Gammaproteobacteria bacterium]
MTTIDAVTAVLAIPGVEENGEIRDALPGESILQEHFDRLHARFEQQCQRKSDRPSSLDLVLHAFLGQPATVTSVDFTYYEKKGVVYPALVFDAQRIVSVDGESLAPAITERFRADDARYTFAELIGKEFGVEWVSVFATFGPSG